MMPKDAVTVPRFSTGHQENSFNPNPDRKETLGTLGSLTLGDRIDESVRRELANRGHKIGTTSRPIAHPVMIYIDPNTGMIYAAGDPEAKRHAAALENTSP
jgi:gamma-glutamyltranspeptidase